MTAQPADTTVAIVGAGPAGLVIAHVLQRAGIDFVVLERHAQSDMGSMAKAGAIDYRTVEALKSVDIADRILTFDQTNYCCEFRTPEESVVFDYGTITGDRPHYVYPQHELVARLRDALVAEGGDIRFGMEVAAVDRDEAGVTLSIVGESGGPSTIRCQVVAGCDGARGVISGALRGCTVVEQSLPVRWLAVLGNTAPLEPHTIYAAHPRGFAGQMRRLPTLTRFYLEVPATDTIADWPESRVREELTTRLLVPGRLDDVEFVEPSLVDLRMKMTTPMQDDRVFVAGDAAHVITPAGGKGMNLAIQDAVELAQGFIERFGPRNDGTRLDHYSDTRLPAIWRTQAFSRWMLRLILAGSDDTVAGDGDVGPSFGAGLRQGWVSALQHDPILARWFSYAYAGVDPD
ncbi:MAG TPA: FAD-dependent monooxygenase [Ilumatobacteraceae bacterium]|nr:FAD-dependent monooxygenase [Ilumatobacteraceae bacterium]